MKKLKFPVATLGIRTILIFTILTGFLITGLPAVSATAADVCGDNSKCGAGDPGSGSNSKTTSLSGSLKSNPIVKDLNTVVNFLGVGVGIVVIADLIIGGIQYSMAGGSPDAVGKAKTRITNGLLALVVYLLIFGFMQWIVPGGVFNSS